MTLKLKSLPRNWSDISFSKGLKLLQTESPVERLALLADKTPDEVRKATDIESIFYFTNTFTFMNKMPNQGFPRSVKMGVDRIVFPFINIADEYDLGQCSVGMVEDMQNVLTTKSKEFTGEEERELTDLEVLQIMPEIVAIYIVGTIDEYDSNKVPAMLKRVNEQLSFKDCVCMGYFFLKRLTGLIVGSVNGLPRRHTNLKRLELAFIALTMRLGFTPRLI